MDERMMYEFMDRFWREYSYVFGVDAYLNDDGNSVVECMMVGPYIVCRYNDGSYEVDDSVRIYSDGRVVGDVSILEGFIEFANREL